MIHYVNFELLPLEEKVNALGKDGIYLMNRQNQLFNILLYGIYGRYAEAWFFKKSNILDSIDLVSDDKVIDLYLNKITLEFSDHHH